MALIRPKNIPTANVSNLDSNLNAKLATADRNTFLDNNGNPIVRPSFTAFGAWGTYSHSFSSTDSASFTSTSGRQTYPAFDVVSGGNTVGFQTGNGPGQSYYDIPVDGIYTFSFSSLINTWVSSGSHIDAAIMVYDINRASPGVGYPWTSQYYGANVNWDRPTGFQRNQINNGDAIYSPHANCTSYFYVGQRIRPLIAMNSTLNGATVYCSSHNYFQGAYMGPGN